MKIICYGVRPIEEPYFQKLNKYHYDLKLTSEFLNHDNAKLAQGMDAVLLRGNCVADAENLKKFADYGIKYVFTRTVGYDHYDLKAAKDLGIMVSRVPNYSPYAVAELAFTLGMSLFRHVAESTVNTHAGNFVMSPFFFSNEIHNATVGIYGAGKIGATEGKLYHSLGTRVLAYDPYPSKYAEQFVEFVSSDELLAKSDIVSVHVPYFPGKNENLINAEFISKMKKSAIIINTARGELSDTAAIAAAIESNKIEAYGADVTISESQIMGHKFQSIDEIPDPNVKSLMKLYPRVLITPHMGSFTQPALTDMISISFDNFNEALKTGTNKNIVTYQN